MRCFVLAIRQWTLRRWGFERGTSPLSFPQLNKVATVHHLSKVPSLRLHHSFRVRRRPPTPPDNRHLIAFADSPPAVASSPPALSWPNGQVCAAHRMYWQDGGSDDLATTDDQLQLPSLSSPNSMTIARSWASHPANSAPPTIPNPTQRGRGDAMGGPFAARRPFQPPAPSHSAPLRPVASARCRCRAMSCAEGDYTTYVRI